MTSVRSGSPAHAAPGPASSRRAAESRSGAGEPASPKSTDQTVLICTAVIGLGLMLTTLPLRSVFTDWTWLGVTIASAAPYWIIVSFFRAKSAPLWWHSLLGLLGSGLVLAWIFVPQNLALGIVPTPASLSDVDNLIADARKSLQDGHAPLASTGALRFMTAGLLSLLVALTDILGVGLRRPLLAAAPMIEILAIASTTSSQPASPIWFVAAALGFLLIVLAGTRLQDRAWGPSIDGTVGRLGGVRVIAVTAIVAALAVPVVLPGRSVNIIAKATHHRGNGSASGGQTVLSNFAALRGSLKRGDPIDLMKVTVTKGSNPYYVRQAVLSQFTSSGWVQTPESSVDQVTMSGQDYSYDLEPGGNAPDVAVDRIVASFNVLGLGGANLPILANPIELPGSLDGTWNRATSTVGGQKLKRDMTYDETADQPAPTRAQLTAAAVADSSRTAAYLDLPPQPAAVVSLARKLTQDASSTYAKALAISDYFTNGKNGFTYSLDGPTSDGQAAILSFLSQKKGYCQQYAATAAVLMREAGLPSRVVLGYTHTAPDSTGAFTVTTLDAHAWVEVYFDGIGWIPFDPTPLTGSDAARAVALPYAQHTTASVGPAPGRSVGPSAVAPTLNRPQSDPASQAQVASTAQSAKAASWPGVVLDVVAGLAVLAILLLGPSLLRRHQRRRRVALALRSGNAEPLWQELTASALDRNVLWPDTLTVAQVPAWLGQRGLDERGTIAVAVLAERVQVDRFSARPYDNLSADTIAGFDQALRRWSRRAERREKLLSRWVPRSLLHRPSTSRR